MIRSILLVGLGGCIGSILRYLVSAAIPWDKSGFPTATFIVNIAGCLLIGLLYITGSLVLGLLATLGGYALARLL